MASKESERCRRAKGHSNQQVELRFHRHKDNQRRRTRHLHRLSLRSHLYSHNHRYSHHLSHHSHSHRLQLLMRNRVRHHRRSNLKAVVMSTTYLTARFVGSKTKRPSAGRRRLWRR